MPPLRDLEIIAKFCVAFEERTSGGVSWKRVAAEWVRKNLDGSTTHAVDDVIHEHLANSGDIEQVAEIREEYRFHPPSTITTSAFRLAAGRSMWRLF